MFVSSGDPRCLQGFIFSLTSEETQGNLPICNGITFVLRMIMFLKIGITKKNPRIVKQQNHMPVNGIELHIFCFLKMSNFVETA